MKTIYVLSGLGADHRVFQNLNFGNNIVIPIPWLLPEKNERIEDYAKRMAACIQHEKPILAGLSFGGMMSMEIAKHKEFEKIILISSSKTKSEIPALYKWCGILRLQKLVSGSFMKRCRAIVGRVFSIHSSSEKEIVDQMLRDTDPVLLEWSIEKILYWKNTLVPANVFHIHGTKDRILPIRNISCNKVIDKGGHLMVMNRAEEVSGLIQGFI
jgi:pimeloyl-ACP methyl ester carboxylesterase